MSEIEPRGVLLQVAYDGTNFRGWATQKGERTVEETLKGAISAVDARASAPRGTSRTDAGVHAEAQMVAFDAKLPLPPRGWVLAINQHLPDDVCVRAARLVPTGYAPRFSAKLKRYRYRLLLDRIRDPLVMHRAWRIGFELDIEKMRREAAVIVGTHDFAAFRSASDERKETVRTVSRAILEPTDDIHARGRILSIVVEGNAFMHNMVRILVGTLVDIARGRLPEGSMARALEGRERRLAGATAPGHGLTLEATELLLPEEGVSEPWPQ
ncbi:tRNA pseudouridine(38-40) synthase TruA [Pendulispora albinea]|uniref:tRNA pseudouridine synthase A n=1 Tax=Pendulispora albinea TaxID=2741071 RepID=A0ABZ2M107_9BACT